MPSTLNNSKIKINKIMSLDQENGNANKIQNNDNDKVNYNLKIFQSSLNLLAHTLIGAVVGITVVFCFRNGLPMGTTQLHILLCVIGYQLLMSQAILALSSDNGWSAHLRFVDKRRAHWILQIMGSVMALTGSFLMIQSRNVHWSTLHGQFALVAIIFTSIGLVNGLASLYAYEWRNIIPGNFSKISHICFGIVAYGASCISLCYGFDKTSFTNWATVPLVYTTMAFTAAFTFIVIINPSITFYNKSLRTVKNNFV